MEASIRHQGEWAVVKIKGRIQMEKTQEFRDACLKSLREGKIVFVLDGLQFVGSTGMTEFFQCLVDVQGQNRELHMVGLSQDFKRFVACTTAASLKCFDTLDEAFRAPNLTFVTPESSPTTTD